MTEFREAGLLIVGHGSTVNPDSSTPTWTHAAEIGQRGIFREVQCAFWKEEPSLRDALEFFSDPCISDVFVVPNFISEGYFTQTVLPRELELAGPETRRRHDQNWHYCEPVGSHPAMTDLLLRRAAEVAPEVPETESSVLVVAHGTDLNDHSAVAAKKQVEAIRGRARYAEVLNVYMEEAPLVSDWDKLTSAANVIVVPFFVADGLHSYEDIPVLLGIEKQAGVSATSRVCGGEVFRRNPHRLRGRSLYYASAIGTDPKFADVILEQVAKVRATLSTHAR